MKHEIATYVDREAEIISDFVMGNKNAFAKIYKYYFEPLCRYCLSLTRDKSMSEDIVQDVFMTLWNKRESIKNKDTLKSYLYRCVYNAFIDQHRKNAKKINALEEIRMEVIMHVNHNPETNRDKQLAMLMRFIEELPEKRKEVFMLNKLQNYKYREIADQLDISERTVEGQIRKALINLRERFSNWIQKNYF